MKSNVLWIMTDEQRPDSISSYGTAGAPTPHIDRLAAEGTRFASAYCPSPMCVPSRTSLLTGLYPHETGVWQNAENPGARDDRADLVRSFAESGYASASFGKQHYLLPEQGFEHEEMIVLTDRVGYTDYGPDYDARSFGAVTFDGPTPWILGGTFPGSEDETSEAQVVRRSLRWLDERDASMPFFLRLSFNGPHTPVVPPRPWDEVVRVDDTVEATPLEESAPEWIQNLATHYAGADRLPPGSLPSVRQSYYGYAAYLDHLVGTLLEFLESAGVLDDTLIVYTSDHGTHLGDHGLVQKQTFYEQVVTVPLIIRPPVGRGASPPRGTVIRTPVETRLLLPTLMDLCGLKVEGAPEGLAEPVITGSEPTPNPVFSEYSLNPAVIRTHERLVMVRDWTWKLALNTDSPNQGALYNLETDPGEVENLFESPACDATRRRLTDLISTHLVSA